MEIDDKFNYPVKNTGQAGIFFLMRMSNIKGTNVPKKIQKNICEINYAPYFPKTKFYEFR